MKNSLKALYLMSLLDCSAIAATIDKVYLDEKNNIHYLDSNGNNKKIITNGKAVELKLSPDRHTIAWLINERETTDEGLEFTPSKLAIYRNETMRIVQCQPFIRGYWFWKNGAQFAIDCGGEHFAGREILYDVESLKIIESLYQGKIPFEKRPDWANGEN